MEAGMETPREFHEPSGQVQTLDSLDPPCCTCTPMEEEGSWGALDHPRGQGPAHTDMDWEMGNSGHCPRMPFPAPPPRDRDWDK